MSESEDSDSDSGIRFKTTSTRHSETGSRSYSTAERTKYNYDNRKYHSSRREHSRRSPSNSSRRNRRSRTRSRSRDRNPEKSRRHNNSSRTEHRSEKKEDTSEKTVTTDNVTPETFGPALPPATKTIPPDPKEEPTKKERSLSPQFCGPALPPHLQKKPEVIPEKKILGPMLPPNFQPQLESSANIDPPEIIEENCDGSDMIGPLPIDANMTTAQLELEKRALELKLAKLDSNDSTSIKTDQREEWMLELPAIRSIASLGVTNRQFQTKERPDFSDRSSWTDTPEDKIRKQNQPSTHEDKKQSIQEQAQALYNKKRDLEQEKLATKHKKHKRDKSLVEIHQKKLKKEKKKKKGESQERRPFSREVDLQINRFDKAKTNSVIQKAKLLDTKFSSGETKYL